MIYALNARGTVSVRTEKAAKRACQNSLILKSSEAVSKVTDTASFLGYYSNVALMEGFYEAIL